MKTTYKDIDSYIADQPEKVRIKLEKIRQVIKKTAPDAEEVISYQMPAFRYHGMLLYFAAFQNHIGFYPFTSAIKKFAKELSAYDGSKGTIRFPMEKSIPVSLITKIVNFRMQENLDKAKEKDKLSKKKKAIKKIKK